MSTPIDYMTNEELLAELKKRFEEMAFIGYANRKNKEDTYAICVKSSLHGGFGLIDILRKAADAQENE